MSSGSLSITTGARSLSHYAYRTEDVREFEPKAAKAIDCSMYSLMEQAGQAVFEYIRDHYGTNTKILLIAGVGNNGGDAYVTARLLEQAGFSVCMASIDPDKALVGDALTASSRWLEGGHSVEDANHLTVDDFAVIVDGLLGTGLQGDIKASYQMLIRRINNSSAEVISIDIPSGLNGNTGQPHLDAIHAQVTVTFVGIKCGLLTGIGKYFTGHLVFAPLAIGKVFQHIAKSTAVALSFNDFFALEPRHEHAHKGHFGRLLCIGGNRAMAGAIRLTSEASMRCGAGLVKVFCHPDSRIQVSNGRPELMVATDHLLEQLNWADCIVFGPGLGTDAWSIDVFHQIVSYLAHEDKPIVIDADGLNLLGQQLHKFKLTNAIITPHPAEAARLLGVKTTEVEADRFDAARQLSEVYQATCILKGAGSIIQHTDQAYICSDGNPGMATAGMGDVLAGILGGLVAQGACSKDAAMLGTCLHGAAADLTAQQYGQRGMLASDIFESMRQLLN